MSLEALFEELDKRALKALQELDALDNSGEVEDDASDSRAEFVGFGERARVFAEIAKYAFERQKMLPKGAKTESKFSVLKRDLHSDRDPPESGAGNERKPPERTRPSKAR